MNFKHPIILGSSSPRRQFLMKAVGFDFTIKSPNVDESYPTDLQLDRVPRYLALKKAQMLVSVLTNEIILTADTIVILENKILNKPENRDQAMNMLSDLSGKSHRVITAVCLTSKMKESCFEESTQVRFRHLSQSDIESYVDEYNPFDKAGAYGAQECLPAGYNPCSTEEINFLASIGKMNLFDESIVQKNNADVSIIEKIDGSYFNVMGLPIHLVSHHLRSFE